VIILAAQGHPNEEIAGTLEIPPQTVGKWRRRFSRFGLAGLEDAPRGGRPVRLSATKLNRVLVELTQPPATRTHWSVRSMARHAGVSKTRVQQLWGQNDIKPHVTRTFKLSRDPNFEPKF